MTSQNGWWGFCGVVDETKHLGGATLFMKRGIATARGLGKEAICCSLI